MKENFEQSMEWLGLLEGLEVHEVDGDSGGRTSAYGVTQRVYDNYRKNLNLDSRIVDLIAMSEIHEIYQKGYWEVCHCDDLEPGLDFVVFQMGVNMGPNRALKSLQKAVGVKVDGQIGPITLRSIACAGPGMVIEGVLDLQCARYMSIVNRNPTQKKFIKGWMNRLTRTAAFIDYPYLPPTE